MTLIYVCEAGCRHASEEGQAWCRTRRDWRIMQAQDAAPQVTPTPIVVVGIAGDDPEFNPLRAVRPA